jgi:hypothetical protein
MPRLVEVAEGRATYIPFMSQPAPPAQVVRIDPRTFGPRPRRPAAIKLGEAKIRKAVADRYPPVLTLDMAAEISGYSGPDADFDDRRSMVLDIAMAACGDMGALASQLRLLECLKGDLNRRLVLHHTNAQLAFDEGVRCAQGRRPSSFFRFFTPGLGEDGGGPERADEGARGKEGRSRSKTRPGKSRPGPRTSPVGSKAWRHGRFSPRA